MGGSDTQGFSVGKYFINIGKSAISIFFKINKRREDETF